MTNEIKSTFALALLAVLAGCGGAGGAPVTHGGDPGGGGSPTPQPPPAVGTYAFHIIGADGLRRSIGIAPVGTAPVLPPGFQAGGPVAHAVVVYPDGSIQVADANGVFLPAGSAYVAKYPKTVQTSAFAQPFVKVSDPQGGVSPGAANVSAYATSVGAQSRIGGIALLPSGLQLFSGEAQILTASATDVDDRVTSLANAQLTWSSSTGATITPIAGTNEATYVAPALASGTQSDIVTVRAAVPAVSAVYSATAAVTTFAPSAGFTATGTLSNGSASVPGGGAIFVTEDAPRIFPSYDFFAAGDASGSYSRLLPPNIGVLLGLSLPAAYAPGGNATVETAVLASSGESSFDTGAAGATGVANLIPPASPGELDDPKDDAANAIPDPIVGVRDGWFARVLTREYPFWADSGVLSILAAPSNVPGAAQPVGSGLFARWCYQWQSANGASALVLIENSAATCTSGGNDAFVITKQSNSGTFAFSEYQSTSGPYSLSGTLQPQTNAQLAAAGSWQQSLTTSGGSVTGDTAAVHISLYGPVSQSVAAPVSQLSERYQYTLSGGVGSVQITQAILSDPVSAITLANATAMLAAQAPAASCTGTTAVCYQGTATISRFYAIAGQVASHQYSSQDALDGDGSELHVVTSSAPSDASGVRMPIAAAGVRAAGSCIICSSQAAFLDSDGSTQLGSYGVDASRHVTFTLLNSVEGSGPGSPVGTLQFVL